SSSSSSTRRATTTSWTGTTSRSSDRTAVASRATSSTSWTRWRTSWGGRHGSTPISSTWPAAPTSSRRSLPSTRSEPFSDLLNLAGSRTGHFRLESGHHTELWLDLDQLFARLAALPPYAAVLGGGGFARRLVAISGTLIVRV